MKKSTLATNILKYLILLSVIGYLGFALVKVIRPAEEMVCTGVELQFVDKEENTLISEEGVRNILTSHKITPKGQSFGNIDFKEIDSLLSSNPYIDTVTTYSNSAGKLCIKVRTMHPVLHILSDTGDEFYLDRTGRIMARGGLNTNLCIVTGNVTRTYASKHLVTLGNFLCEDPSWSLQAQQVNITKDGEVQLFPRVGDFTIELGEPTHIAEKLSNIRIFYEKGLTAAGWNKYKTISAAYKDQIVCTKK